MIKLPPDVTFLIQLVSFLVFWQLMRVLLFQPAQRALAVRKERTSGARARAEALRADAARFQAELQSKLDEARDEGNRQADVIRRQAEADEQATLARYQEEAAAVLERERGVTTQQFEAARVPLRAQAQELAASVVTRVLGRAA